MKLTPLALLFVCAIAVAEDAPKVVPKTYLSSKDALEFAEAAALAIQQDNELLRSQLRFESAKQAAKDAQERYAATMTALRQRAKMSENCNPEATGKRDNADEKYVWSCPK